MEQPIGENGEDLSRLSSLYPYADINELPLCWSNKDKANFISLSENNLKVHYKGNGKAHKDAASVRTSTPIPSSCLLYYFEIKVLSKGRDGYMGIGLAAQGANMQRLPGWDKQSYGYHGDDGNSFCSSGTGQPYGPIFTTNDIIGCGYNIVENNCFFTKNGHNLGIAFSDLPNIPLYPTIGLQTPGEEVEANFGLEPFCYDIEDDMRALRQRITGSIINHPVKYTEWQSAINKLVQSWLIHNGYCSTAEVFSSATKQEFKENVQQIKQRLKIQQLVLAGKIEDAIQLTNKLYPDVLTDNPNLLFALKCRQFVEMISESCGKTTIPSLAPSSSSNSSSLPSGSTKQLLTEDLQTPEPITSTITKSVTSTTTKTPSINNTTSPSSSKTAHSICSPSSSSNSPSSSSDPSFSTSSTSFISNNCNNNGNSLNPTTNGTIPISDCNGNSFGDKMDVDHDEPDEEGSQLQLSNSQTTGDFSYKSVDDSSHLSMLINFGRELHKLSKQLKKKNGTNDQNKKMLLEVSSLMAYSDPNKSPIAWQLHPSERESVCQQLNNAIVMSELGGCCHRPPLETIVKHTKSLLKLNGQCGAWLLDQL